jgi:hypothetical protein
MKRFTLLFFSFLIFLLFFLTSCKNTNNSDISIQFIDHSQCKEFKSQFAVPQEKDCLEYHYDHQLKILKFYRSNAGFNCCPGELSVEIQVSGNQISISENESAPNCHCLCLYDMNYQIENIHPGTYEISINEPYIHENDSKIRFELILPENDCHEPVFCFERHGYPWH